MSLPLLSQAAARSSRSLLPATFRSLLFTAVPKNAAAPQRSFTRGAALHSPRIGWSSGWVCVAGSWRAASGLQACSPPPKLLVFQRTIWGSGGQWMRSPSWLQRGRRSAMLGGIRAARVRHFGSGGYLDPQLVLGALIATNVSVFFLWRSVGGNFMQSNFVVSAEALKQGRVHTLVSSAFSQIELQHLLSNMIGLYFFGSEIGNLFGGQRLLMLYLAGGIVGSLTHVAYWSYFKPWAEGYPRRSSHYSPGLLGASGAVNAIILLDILLFPTRIIYLNLIIPVPAALFGIVIIGSDLWAATDGSRSGSSPAAHLGGAAMGALAWLKWK